MKLSLSVVDEYLVEIVSVSQNELLVCYVSHVCQQYKCHQIIV